MFVEQLFFPYDRVGIVTFGRHAHEEISLTNNEQDILNAINNLKVYSGEPCPYLGGEPVSLAANNSVCRWYNTPAGETFRPGGARWSTPPTTADITNWHFNGMDCPQAVLGQTDLVGHCNSTNMGAGLAIAGNMLARGTTYETGHPLAGQPVPIAVSYTHLTLPTN